MGIEQPKKSEQIDEGRRRFFKEAAKVAAAAALGVLADEGVRLGSAEVQERINAEVERRVQERLAKGYAESGDDYPPDTTSEPETSGTSYGETSEPSRDDIKD